MAGKKDSLAYGGSLFINLIGSGWLFAEMYLGYSRCKACCHMFNMWLVENV